MGARNPYLAYANRSAELFQQELEKRFDSKGQINAWDQKDALRNIKDLLDKQAKAKTPIMRKAVLSEDDKRKIVSTLINDRQKGLQIIAQAMGEAVYKIVDYAGWARKVFDVQTIPQGEVFRIPKDIDVMGWVVAEDGQTIVSQLKTKYVFPGEFKVTAFVEIDIMDIMQANWDIFDRGVQRAFQQIMRNEDVRAVNLLTTAATSVNDLVTFATLNLGVFEDLRYQVERWRLTVDKFLISRAELVDIIKTMYSQVEIFTERELILAGYIGNVLGANLVISAGMGVEEVIPPGRVFAVTEGKFLGRLGERLPLQSEEYSTLVKGEMKRAIGQYEIIGFGVANSRAVAMATK